MELFFDENLVPGKSLVEIYGDEAKHIRKVLRFKVGDIILITNGHGLISKASILSISTDKILCEVISEKKIETKKINVVALIPVLHHRDRFEFAIEKLSELGVDSIQPYTSQRTIKKRINHNRIKKILIAAIKQSLNPFLPEFGEVITLNQFLKQEKANVFYFVGHPKGHSIFEVIQKLDFTDIQKVILCVGPEGDFTDEELNNFKEHNATFIKLSNTRLKSETAIISLACMVQSLLISRL